MLLRFKKGISHKFPLRTELYYKIQTINKGIVRHEAHKSETG